MEGSNENLKKAKCAKTDPKHKPDEDDVVYWAKLGKQGGKQGAKPNPVKDSASVPIQMGKSDVRASLSIQKVNRDVKPATFKAPVGGVTRKGNPQMAHINTRTRYTCRTGWSGTNQCADFPYQEVSGLVE